MDIHPSVWASLGFYVYAYVDPRDESIRYVGKGKGARAIAHLTDTSDSEKVRWLAGLAELGLEPRIDILARHLSESQALRVERTIIDAIGIGPHRLTNKVRGHGVKHGRESILEIALRLEPEPLVPHHSLLLVRLNKHYRAGLSPHQLYDLARGVWKVGPRRDDVEVVLALAHGLVRGVFIPEYWAPAGTTEYVHEPRDDVDNATFSNRWEFVGRIADQDLQQLYYGRDASHVFRRGNANSFGYLEP